MQIFVIRFKPQNEVEAFEHLDDAINTGVEFIRVHGMWRKWTEGKTHEEISKFTQHKNSELVEFYTCSVRESAE